MIISTNWLKKFIDIDMPVDELATLIGARLVEIEEVVNLDEKYQGVIIVKVVECAKLEGSDHLNVTKIDDGGKATDVERDENGLVQVVCGAPNVHAGMLAAWLPPNSTVPQTINDVEPFVLGARKLRGVMSNGMLASATELDLYEDHTGILEIDVDAAPGSSFAEVVELNDYLLDIENKSLTHRPDTFGIIGFAREVAAIQGKPFQTPDWLMQQASPHPDGSLADVPAPVVAIDDTSLSDRFQAVVLTGADGSAKSPLVMQTYLARIGMRPINAVVDVTNYLMMLTGQPMGIYDYDKILAIDSDARIHVRSGRPGETLELLDGRTIELTVDDIVVAAGETAIGLAGAMGGANTVVDENTKTIMIEAATFNLYSLRATQMRHGIFSEAITRFTKGQPAQLTAPVLVEAMRLMTQYAGARAATSIAEAYPGKKDSPEITLGVQSVNDVLGTTFTASDIIETLRNVEFKADLSEDAMIKVIAPFWRSDIHIDEDVIEEVGRLNGFDSINPALPVRDFIAVRPSSFDEFRANVRKALVRAGTNEVLTYSFIHGDVMQKAHQDVGGSYRITNSISPELQYYRQTITPSLLGLVHSNVKQGYDAFAVFELNKTHPKQYGVTDEGVPVELDSLAFVVTSKKENNSAPYYQAKTTLDYLAQSLGLEFAYSPIDADLNDPQSAPFEHRRSALVTDKKTNIYLGIVGEYKRTVSRSFKLPTYTAGFEMNTRALHNASLQTENTYAPLSRYPGADRDICFQVAAQVSYAQVIDCVNAALEGIPLQTSVVPIDIYQAEASLTKNITIRIKLTADDRTLTGDEVTEVINKVAGAAIDRLSAVII